LSMIQAVPDKRKFYRHPWRVPIQYYERQERIPDISPSVDVSEGGIAFYAPRFIAKGTHVHLKIPVGDQMFEINGIVAYSNRLPRLDRYRTGVAFLDPTSAFRAKLAEQMLEIQKYRDKVSEKLGHSISEEEAALQWIEKYAQHFSQLF